MEKIHERECTVLYVRKHQGFMGQETKNVQRRCSHTTQEQPNGNENDKCIQQLSTLL